jgi:hypothetical protein
MFRVLGVELVAVGQTASCLTLYMEGINAKGDVILFVIPSLSSSSRWTNQQSCLHQRVSYHIVS